MLITLVLDGKYSFYMIFELSYVDFSCTVMAIVLSSNFRKNRSLHN